MVGVPIWVDDIDLRERKATLPWVISLPRVQLLKNFQNRESSMVREPAQQPLGASMGGGSNHLQERKFSLPWVWSLVGLQLSEGLPSIWRSAWRGDQELAGREPPELPLVGRYHTRNEAPLYSMDFFSYMGQGPHQTWVSLINPAQIKTWVKPIPN